MRARVHAAVFGNIGAEELAFLFFDYVAPSVTRFVSSEVGIIYTLGLFGFLTALRTRSRIAVFRMETIVYTAVELLGTVKPWADADEDAIDEPFRSVVSGGSAVIWSSVIVSIGTLGGWTDFHGDLGCCFRGCGCDANYSNTGQ